MSNHNQGWLAREQRRLAAASTPQAGQHPTAPGPEQQPPAPAPHAGSRPPQQPGEYQQQVQQPAPSAQQWPAQHPHQPHQPQPHSDSQFGAPYGFVPGTAPREEGPQR